MTNGILVSQVILAPALIDALLFYVVVVEKLCAKLVVMATGSSLLVLFVAVWLSTASGVPHHRREINGNGPLQNGLFESKYVSLVMLGSMAVKSKLKSLLVLSVLLSYLQNLLYKLRRAMVLLSTVTT